MSDKYNADQLAALGAKGQAFKNAAGDWSFPIADLEDLHNAIRAVGRAGGSHDAVRRYIMRRAQAMGHEDLIPADWHSGGQNSSPVEAEIRVTESVLIEVRGKPGAMTIGGYAAKFDKRSDNLGGFIERIDHGFFDRSKGHGWPGVMARYNHDDNMLLGRSDNGSLRLDTDLTGLRYEVDLLPARVDVYEQVQRGDIRQSSFAFAVAEDDWGMEEGITLRTLVSGRLIDVAPVNTPAYQDTSVGLRSLAKRFDADLEEVRAMAAKHELTRFFQRTDDTSKRPVRGSMALARIRNVPSV